MSTWTPELKATAIAKYLAAEPTPNTSTEVIKEIAEEMKQSPNGVRMILVEAGEYIKKDATSKPTATGDKKEAPKRASKEDSIAALTAAIEARGGETDVDILSKLTGKAAVYFTTLLSK